MIFFIGAFSDPESEKFKGSAAGAKVQFEIIESLAGQLGLVSAFIMPEVPSWPRGPLFVGSSRHDRIWYLPILNVKGIKKIWFFLILCFYFFLRRPKFAFQYNSSILGVCFSVVARFSGCKSILILQDLNAPISFSLELCFRPVQAAGYLYSKLLRSCFDYYIPISETSIEKLGLPRRRSMVFQGGALMQDILSAKSACQAARERSAVFAGALEEYNGIDLLVDKWPTPDKIKIKLYVFGRGRLENYVAVVSKKNSNIVFRGFQAPSVVHEYVSRASFNFCLRYSKGLDQDFFFPSKFFGLILSGGSLICNEFKSIPGDLKEFLTIIDDELDGLNEILSKEEDKSVSRFCEKVEYIELNYTWSSFMSRFLPFCLGKS